MLTIGEWHKARIIQNIIYIKYIILFAYYLSVKMYVPQCMCGGQGDNFVDSFFSFHFHLYVAFFISVALIKYLNKKQLQEENIYLVTVPSYSS